MTTFFFLISSELMFFLQFCGYHHTTQHDGDEVGVIAAYALAKCIIFVEMMMIGVVGNI